MDSMCIISKNSKTSEPHVLILNLADKLDLRRGEKSIALSNVSIYYLWKNIKGSYNNNKFKISVPILNDKFELPDGWHSVSDVEDYFEYILKKHGENTDNPPIKVYVIKVNKRITFKIKTGYHLEFLTFETMKLLGSTENKITRDKNGENVLPLEIIEVVLVQCNFVNDDYQQDLRVLYTYVPNKPFGILLKVSPIPHIFKKNWIQNFNILKYGLRMKIVNH